MKKHFLIDKDALPALGPISTRYQWCCENGCGECQPVLVEFRTTHCSFNGMTEHEETEPRMVSSCCGGAMFLWDVQADDDGPVGFDGQLANARQDAENISKAASKTAALKARVSELEAELAAIGAGGVESLRKKAGT